MAIFGGVEDECRDEIMKQGGSISHHHGVGKIRKRYLSRTLPPMAIELMRKIKKAMDPKNIFGINNTVYREDDEEKEDEVQ